MENNRFKRFFINAKNVFEWIALFSSVLSFISAGYLMFSSNNIHDCTQAISIFKWIYAWLIILFICIIFLAILFAYRNANLIEEKKKYENLHFDLEELKIERKEKLDSSKKINSIKHNLHHMSRDILCSMTQTSNQIITLTLRKEDSKKELENLKGKLEKEFNNYRIELVSNTKELFDIITNDTVSVSIKLFDPIDENVKLDANNLKVQTFIRDSVSKRQRNLIDVSMPNFKVRSNTAFREILHSNNRSYYFCNNLMEEKDYDNSNSNWRKHYNACLVSALAVADSNEKQYNKIIGAICIDNKKGNFNDHIAHDSLASIADVFSSALFQFFSIQKSIKNYSHGK